MLNKKYRLDKNLIPKVVKYGSKKFFGEYQIKYILDDKLEQPQFAFIVSKKVSKSAVVRNTIKRKLRANVYTNIKAGKYLPGYYVFLVYNADLAEKNSNEIDTMI